MEPIIALALWMLAPFMTSRSETRAVAKKQCFLKPSTYERMGKGQASPTGMHRRCGSLNWMGGQLTGRWPRRGAVIIMLDQNKFVLYSGGRSYPNILDKTVWGVRAHVSAPRLLEDELTTPVWLFKKRKEAPARAQQAKVMSTHTWGLSSTPPPWWKKRLPKVVLWPLHATPC